MGKACLHAEHREALEKVKTLFTNEPSNTWALGAQLKIFSAGYTVNIKDDEKVLLFNIVDKYVDNPTIVYYCMLALKCNISKMAKSVLLEKMCMSITSARFLLYCLFYCFSQSFVKFR